MTRASAIVTVVLTTGLLLGCTPRSEWGGKPTEDPLVRKYVSLSPSTTELIHYATNAGAQFIVGKTANCDHPANLPAEVVVSGTEPNYELIAQLKPQIVIFEKDLYSDATIAKIEELGFKTMPVETDSLEEFRATTVEISQLSGTELAASKYLDTVQNQLEILRSTMPDGYSACAIIGGPSQGYMASGKTTLLSDLIHKAGGEFRGPDASRYVPVNIEQLVQWNPDVIITTGESVAAILKDPAMQTVPAVREGRLFGVKPEYLLRDGGRVDKLIDGLNAGIDRVIKLREN